MAGIHHRLAYAAAHVVMRESYREVDDSIDLPGSAETLAEHIDWETTMQLRRRLDQLGFGVAEAMDTAQRFYLGWDNAARLIRECGALQLDVGFVAGAGLDHVLEPSTDSEIVDAVCYQIDYIQSHGGVAIILPIVPLSVAGRGPNDYVRIYSEIFDRCEGPLLVHWLGEMFMPALRGYFPGDSFERVMEMDPAKVRGCKLSLLDAELEERVRRTLLPREQIVLTGDDFNFADLIKGRGEIEGLARIGDNQVAIGEFSHALLGVLDGIADPASRALEALADEDEATYDRIMRPCELLGQHVFEAPTRHYKAGLAFLSWANGLQDNYMLVNHEENARSREHYLRVAALAEHAGAIGPDAPERLAEFRCAD